MIFPISRRSVWLLLIAVVLIWFGNLEYRKLIRPDEGRYAEIPREMVVSGDWTTPRLNELKYFESRRCNTGPPPWLMRCSANISGPRVCGWR